jgi:hypothetical protein
LTVNDHTIAEILSIGKSLGLFQHPRRDPLLIARRVAVGGRGGKNGGASATFSDGKDQHKKVDGCTIFYMDTNVKWEKGMWQGKSWLLPSADLHELTRRHPDVLVFPEFGRFGYWGCCMPYGELRGGSTRTSDAIRAAYGFSGPTEVTNGASLSSSYGGLSSRPQCGIMVFFTRRFSMDLRKCEHCGNMFWGDAEARFCPLCAVAEKGRERTELPRESSDRQLQPAAA